MKRWNGWGYARVDVPVPKTASPTFGGFGGCGQTSTRCQSGERGSERSRVEVEGQSPHGSVDPEARLRHSRGQSLSDWMELRYGSVNSFPDAVAYPTNEEELQEVFNNALKKKCLVIPYGGGTSVVGHITPPETDKPVLSLSLERMNQLLEFDEENHLATFQAGVAGPDLEAQLRNLGFVLGHYPQSF